MLKGQPEVVNRRTDNKMAKRKRTYNDRQNISRLITKHPVIKFGTELRCSRSENSSCSTSGVRLVTVVTTR